MSEHINRVALIGTGAMGGMYAAHFAKAGFQVGLVASGERATRLRAGVTVNGEPLPATVVDQDITFPADLAIFAVKDRQLEASFDEAARVIGPDTTIISILNGLDSEERIAARFGAGRVLLCVALGMDAQREGTDIRFRQAGRLAIGEASNLGEPPARLVGLRAALDRAGLAWFTPEDMRHQLWWKFMANTGTNQASAVLRAPYGLFQHPGDALDLMHALMDEVLAVSVPEGVNLGAEDVASWEDVVAKMPPQGWTSMRQDIEAGRVTEVETFAGRVVALGAKHGIPTPYNQAMLWILRASVAGE